MVRLRPMSEEEFARSLDSAIRRHAEDSVRRGQWRGPEALEASAAEFRLYLPQGRATAGAHFCHLEDEGSGATVGELWYHVLTNGGTTRVWVDWVWVDPPHRRRGFASAALRAVEEEAIRIGAIRIGLSVYADNPGARALYERLGFVPEVYHMMRSPGASRAGPQPPT